MERIALISVIREVESKKHTLTSTSNREHNLGRMPCSDTSNFAETLVSLTRQFLGSPSVSDPLKSVTLGDGNNIDIFILLKHCRDIDRLLEKFMGIFDLVSD